ncbi:MAG: SMC-Scp complex subunit ScpB [Thermoguttaceae bacterium]|nr:SMC-Scp complex subunit ScpB [Thermoguttaceae bacterium]MDW8078158.1 SMC-Scp complex subunit ScpB [Thermoguttaceae bacterium]
MTRAMGGELNSDDLLPEDVDRAEEFVLCDNSSTAVVEAILFAAKEPLPARRIAELAGLADATQARTLIRSLNTQYDNSGSALKVYEVAGGFQLLTRPEVAPYVRAMLGEMAEPNLGLSPAVLETLTIVAYKQPVLRAEIEAIRGAHSGEALRQLEEEDLIRVVGRAEDLGRPFLYGTTRRFLEVFGLRDISDLPPLSDVDKSG